MKVTQGQTGSSGTRRQWVPSTRGGRLRQVVVKLGLGGADVTLKEVLTHGAASVAEQQLCRRFNVPGLGGQR